MPATSDRVLTGLPASLAVCDYFIITFRILSPLGWPGVEAVSEAMVIQPTSFMSSYCPAQMQHFRIGDERYGTLLCCAQHYAALVQGANAAERYAFLVEWLDPASGITWKYHLLYHPQTHEVEMVSEYWLLLLSFCLKRQPDTQSQLVKVPAAALH